MAYRLAAASSAFVKFSIGAFNGYIMANPLSAAYLLKRNTTGGFDAIHVVDDNAADFRFFAEFNGSHQLVADTGTDGWGTTATFNNTTDWMILAYEWNGGGTAGDWIWRWKIGSGAWQSESETPIPRGSGAMGSGYHHIIGNNFSLSDDGDFDIVCAGAIRADLGQSAIESLTMTDFASWEAVFTGSSAWLVGFEEIGSLTDRTGNGGDETSRAGAGISLVSDPASWTWGGATGPSQRFRWRD